jgi:uroporphyrinogen-III synthase
MISVASTRILSAENRFKVLSHGFAIQDYDLLAIHYITNINIVKRISLNSYPLIFTSANGLIAYREIIKVHEITPLNNDVFVIEGRTSELASQLGLKILATAKDSDALAKEILKHKFKNYLHMSSNIRLDSWKDKLAEENVNVETIEIYFKEKMKFTYPKFQTVLFFSPSQIDAFLDNNSLLKDIPAFCIGESTAKHLKKLGHKNIIVSEQSNEDRLINTMIQYFKEKYAKK